MQHVEDASSTLTDEDWQEVGYQRSAVCETPLHPKSRVARFFNALAASMARQSWSPSRPDGIVYPADILAQKYPHLYIQVMCG